MTFPDEITRWDMLPPDGPCMHPDGHDLVPEMILSSPIPESVVCVRCGRLGSVELMVVHYPEAGLP